ncbi:hypothetical protein ABZP36_013290 [Zizania latifolia]
MVFIKKMVTAPLPSSGSFAPLDPSRVGSSASELDAAFCLDSLSPSASSHIVLGVVLLLLVVVVLQKKSTENINNKLQLVMKSGKYTLGYETVLRTLMNSKDAAARVEIDECATPLEYLTQALKEDIQKIWDVVRKPEVYKEAALSEFFNVDVTALPSYEEKEELFKEHVGQHRQRFIHSIAPGDLAADRREGNLLFSLWKV